MYYYVLKNDDRVNIYVEFYKGGIYLNSNKIKFLISIVLLYIFICLINCSHSYAKNNQFKYEIDKRGRAIITSYIGNKGNVTIPSTIDGHKVIAIGDHAFNETRNLTNGRKLVHVVISEGIKTIGDFAFVNCKNLETVKLPNSLEDIGDQTFIQCSNLTKINIPPKVTKLGFSGYMFQECGFTSFTVPETMKSIPSCTFRICKNLKNFIVYSRDVELGSNLFEHGSKDVIIHGYSGSTAEAYAKEYNLKFNKLANKKQSHISVKSIKFKSKQYTMTVGQKITFKPIILPTSATNKNLRWATSDKNIALVKNGLVKAIKPGKVKLIVATVDGNHKAYCIITVQKSNSNDTKEQTGSKNVKSDKDNTNSTPSDMTPNPKSSEVPNKEQTGESSTKSKSKTMYKKIIHQSPIPFLIIFIPLTIIFVVDITLVIRKKAFGDIEDEDNSNNSND